MNWRELVETGKRFDEICQEELPALGAYDIVMKELDRSRLQKAAKIVTEVSKTQDHFTKWIN